MSTPHEASKGSKLKLQKLCNTISRAWRTARKLIHRPHRSRGVSSHTVTLASPQERLPTELLDYIIDFLHDDTIALRNCSLVCHAFVSSARFHLFHDVTIKQWTFSRAMYLFTDKAPELATYIRRLSFETSLKDVETMQRKVDGSEPHKMTATFFAALAPLALNVLDLTLKVVPIDKDSLEQLMSHFPKMTSFTVFDCWFRSYSDVDEVLRAHPLITSLRCSRTAVVHGLQSSDGSDIVGHKLKIPFLRVNESHWPSPLPLMPWIMSRVSPEYLIVSVLRLDQFPQLNQALLEFLEMKHLHIIFNKWRPYDAIEADSSPSALRLVPRYPATITTFTVDGKLYSMRLVIYLLAHVDQPSFARVETINIYGHFSEQNIADVPSESWARMDQNLNALSSLGAINIYNACPRNKDNHIHVELEAIEERLPVLAVRKMMTLRDSKAPFD